MSRFANPAGSAQQGAEAYVRGLLEVLGERDPVRVLSEQEQALSSRIEGLSDSRIRRPEREGKWSILQVLQHLADSELVFGWRLRMVLAHDEPPIQGFDQDLWANRLGYAESNREETMEQLRALRRANLRIIRRLSPAQLQRAGMHSERGKETVSRMIQLIAAHDLVHLRQIDRIKTA